MRGQRARGCVRRNKIRTIVEDPDVAAGSADDDDRLQRLCVDTATTATFNRDNVELSMSPLHPSPRSPPPPPDDRACVRPRLHRLRHRLRRHDGRALADRHPWSWRHAADRCLAEATHVSRARRGGFPNCFTITGPAARRAGEHGRGSRAGTWTGSPVHRALRTRGVREIERRRGAGRMGDLRRRRGRLYPLPHVQLVYLVPTSREAQGVHAVARFPSTSSSANGCGEGLRGFALI